MTTIISLFESNNNIVCYERQDVNTRVIKKFPLPTYFYVNSPNGEYESIYPHLKFNKITCANRQDYKIKVEQYKKMTGVVLHETDITFIDKIILDNYLNIKAHMMPNICFFDIEVDYVAEEGFPEARYAKYPINSIALWFKYSDKFVVFCVPPDDKVYDMSILENDNTKVVLCKNEYELLFRMCDAIKNTDILSAWNSRLFDITYIVNRLKLYKLESYLCFDNTKEPKLREFEIYEGKTEYTYDLFGRVHLDYMELFKKFTFQARQSYSLDSICEEELKMNKIHFDGTLEQLYKNDFVTFVKYNIHDVVLLKLLDEKMKLMKIAVGYAHNNCAPIQNVLGTLKITESWINKYVRNQNKIVPNRAIKLNRNEEKTKAQGAIVLQPKRGIKNWIGIIDVTSLYPSVIRCLNMSPETIIGHFEDSLNCYKKILKQTDDVLDFVAYQLGADDEIISKTAKEWYDICKKYNYSISPYGVIFDQTFDGVIPKVLEGGFNDRKRMQKLKKENGKLFDETKDINYKLLMEDYDAEQHIQKISLNSLYGALLNEFCVYFDKRLGASVTAAGRCVTKNMGEYVHKFLEGSEVKMQSRWDPKEKCEYWEIDSKSVIYGDTDSIQFSMGHVVNNVESACFLADTIETKVNEFLVDVVRSEFLVQDQYKDIIKVGRELVSDKGIYYTRKKYVLHVLDLEGKKVDKFKTMGTDNKKSNNPKAIQNFVQNIFEDILKHGKTENEINDYIELERNNVRKNIIDYGSPKKIKNIESYFHKFLIEYISKLIEINMIDLNEVSYYDDNTINFIITEVSRNFKKINIEDVVDIYDKYEEFNNIDNNKLLEIHNHIYLETKSELISQDVLNISTFKFRMPGHVRAAINYNIMLLVYSDTEAKEISSGENIKVFYIKPNNEFKITSIAFLTDTIDLPEWFTDNFEIDVFKMTETLIERKVDIYVRSLGMHIDSEAVSKMKKLFVFENDIDNEINFDEIKDDIFESEEDDDMHDY